MKLKRYLTNLLLVAMCAAMLPSCLSSNDETTTDEHCYISAFTLGTLKRTVYTTTSAGEDSVYTVSFSATNYPMSVDQRNLVIENKDSLPYGTRVQAALATITYTGVICYKKPSDVDWTLYSSSDSIDFSQPLDFAVYSQTGNSVRHYTVKLNVHKVDGSKCDWRMVDENAELDQMVERKAVVGDNRLVMVGKTAMGAVVTATRKVDLTDEWTLQATTGAEEAIVSTLQAEEHGTYYMSTTTGAILKSQDGVTWQKVGSEQDGLVLAGYAAKRLYATQNGSIMSSSDEGATWVDETRGEEAQHVPGAQLTVMELTQDNGYQRMVLLGNSEASEDGKVEVWSKSWRQTNGADDAVWMYYPHTYDNKYLCPQYSPLIVFPYAEGIVAMGGKTANGEVGQLDKIRYSADFGLTWRSVDEYYLSKDLIGREGALAATADANNFIWIIVGKETWRGRQNEMGFAQSAK